MIKGGACVVVLLLHVWMRTNKYILLLRAAVARSLHIIKKKLTNNKLRNYVNVNFLLDEKDMKTHKKSIYLFIYLSMYMYTYIYIYIYFIDKQ